ncbi:MAG: hypothetical protein U9N77_03175 [Thermodesulfobacteriota bacterium]|nr:hypothetical protein [Thermodesulfobacteriota bacterium]
MDFDSIILFLFFIVFFVLPAILKQVLAIMKKKAPPKKAKKKLSLFDRISDQIRQFVQKLENQAKQQKKETREQDTAWEMLAEDEDPLPLFESIEENADFSEPEPEKAEQPLKKRIQPQIDEQEPCIKEPLYPLQKKYCLKSNPLQNAIIWSEIISKPLALRNK